MSIVSEQHAQGMRPGFEAYLCRSAAVAEMDVIGVRWNRQTQIRQVCVDQEVMMTRIRLLDPGLRDTHALDAKLDCNRAGDRLTVLRRYEKYPGVWRRRRAFKDGGGCLSMMGTLGERLLAGGFIDGFFAASGEAERQYEQRRGESRESHRYFPYAVCIRLTPAQSTAPSIVNAAPMLYATTSARYFKNVTNRP